MKELTFEEFAEFETTFPKMCYPTKTMEIIAKANIIKGAKWQEEKNSIDAEKYAEFCIICYENKLPCVRFKDWVKQLKNI
jgi:hypothetical protein